MAQIIDPKTVERLAFAAAPFLEACHAEAVRLTLDDADAESLEAARYVQTIIIAMTAVLQGCPLNQFGVVVSIGAIYGTVLGQADPKARRILHSAFDMQAKATLAEVAAGQMPHVGEA